MIKNIIRKVLKESYEDHVLYDILNRDDEDPEKIKYQKIIKHIESPESDEGENWSEKERNFLRKSLSNVKVSGYKEVNPKTKKSNELKTAKSSAETLIKKIDSILSNKDYSPNDSNCVSKLQKLSNELKKLSKNKDLSMMADKEKEINVTLNKCSFTRK